jgi:hypothetical protein
MGFVLLQAHLLGTRPQTHLMLGCAGSWIRLDEITTRDVLTLSTIRNRTVDFTKHFEARAAKYMSSLNILFGRDNIYSEVLICVS